MSLSLGLLAAYFAGGVKFMMNEEGWEAADAFYFWSLSVHESNCRCPPPAAESWPPRHQRDASSIDLRTGA